MLKYFKLYFIEIILFISVFMVPHVYEEFNKHQLNELSQFHHVGTFDKIVKDFELKNISLYTDSNGDTAYKLDLTDEEVKNLSDTKLQIKEFSNHYFFGYNAYSHTKDDVNYTLYKKDNNYLIDKVSIKSGHGDFFNKKHYDLILKSHYETPELFNKEGQMHSSIINNKEKLKKFTHLDYNFNHADWDIFVDSKRDFRKYYYEDNDHILDWIYKTLLFFIPFFCFVKYFIIKYNNKTVPLIQKINNFFSISPKFFKNRKKRKLNNEVVLEKAIQNQKLNKTEKNINVKIKND